MICLLADGEVTFNNVMLSQIAAIVTLGLAWINSTQNANKKSTDESLAEHKTMLTALHDKADDLDDKAAQSLEVGTAIIESTKTALTSPPVSDKAADAAFEKVAAAEKPHEVKHRPHK